MLISLLRTVLIYGFILFAVRLMGKRQIGELQTTELVVTLLISDLAVIPMQDNGQPLFSGLIPICILVSCEICASYLLLKSGRFRRLVCGKPVIVISEGKLLQQEMRALRMSTEDLLEQLRQKDIFSLREVKFAVVETNGALSVLKQPEYEAARVKDMGIKNAKNSPEAAVISDGEIAPSSLKACGRDEIWLKDLLRGRNLQPEDIFLMTVDEEGKPTIIPKEKRSGKNLGKERRK